MTDNKLADAPMFGNIAASRAPYLSRRAGLSAVTANTVINARHEGAGKGDELSASR